MIEADDSPPIVDVLVQDDAWDPSLQEFARYVADITLTHLSSDASICLVLSNDASIQELNKTYRKIDKPTNVLSFGYNESMGDVVLSFETIQREALLDQKSLSDHVAHMVVHGILHVMGHDHEHEDEALRMEQQEIQILNQLNIRNPYE